VITSTNGTLWLEALAANVPVIAVLPEIWWPLNPNFSHLFADMKTAGLIQVDPERLMDFLESHTRRRMIDWWNSESVQNLRAIFLQTFAKS
jgi:putative transferase (TIGR04331 family)